MAKYSQTSRKRSPKFRRSSRGLPGGGRLRKSTHRGWSLFDPRRDPDTSTSWEKVHYIHFTSYDISSFMLPAKRHCIPLKCGTYNKRRSKPCLLSRKRRSKLIQTPNFSCTSFNVRLMKRSASEPGLRTC